MKSLIMLTAAAMVSMSMASTAFAGGVGFENSGDVNACLNAGAGNGGESVGLTGCLSAGDERSLFPRVGEELDPGNSGAHNNAPQFPPGQEPRAQ
jgi:hypothetical protein